MMKRKYEIIFIFGFTALFLCGIGDWLIGYEPPGGTPLIFGISSTSIADVPVWFYIVSLGFGILSGFGCMVLALQWWKFWRKTVFPGKQRCSGYSVLA